MLKETAAPLNGGFELKFLKNDFKGNIVNPYFLSISKTKIIILLYIPPHTTIFFRFDIFAPADATSFAIASAPFPRLTHTHADTYYLSRIIQNGQINGSIKPPVWASEIVAMQLDFDRLVEMVIK